MGAGGGGGQQMVEGKGGEVNGDGSSEVQQRRKQKRRGRARKVGGMGGLLHTVLSYDETTRKYTALFCTGYIQGL